MSKVIEMRNNYDERIGTLMFDDDHSRLSVRRTASGFLISFPVAVSIRNVKRGADMPVISGLEGVLWAGFESGATVELGRVVIDRDITSGWTDDGSGERTASAYLDWRGTFEELAVYEKIREGRSPQFNVNLECELRYLIDIKHPR